MPSGKIHDAVTFFLVAPTFAATWKFTESPPLAAIVTVAFLFGGLMFGPDLDTRSTQYTRWSFFRFLWYPYQAFFAHRSRWSHGLIFGTLIRVVYFCGAVTLFCAVVFYFAAMLRHAAPPSINQVRELWEAAGFWTRVNVGNYGLAAIFLGLWLGAASHTFTDLAGTFLKTGKVKEFL